jgi:hypothetical protein
MNALVFMTATGMQTLYAWMISEFAQPQWINPLRPNDAPDYFSPAFLMKFGADANRTLAGNVCFGLLLVLFPFLAVHVVNMTQSLVVRVRTLRVGDLSTFIPQWIADVLLLRCITRFGRPEKTAHLLPLVPLQMPGPATSSLVIALACQPKASERQAGLSTKPLQWGVVRAPQAAATTPTMSHSPLERIHTSHSLSTSPIVTTSAPIRMSVSRKPVPVHTASTADEDSEIYVSPTMTGAPHLSGDEAAFATAWFDLVGVSSSDEEKAISTTVTEKALTMTPSGSDDIPGHCAFSAEQVDEIQPGRMYTGIRRGEGNLNWKRQVEQLFRQFLEAVLFAEFLDDRTLRHGQGHGQGQGQRGNTDYAGTAVGGGGRGSKAEGES